MSEKESQVNSITKAYENLRRRDSREFLDSDAGEGTDYDLCARAGLATMGDGTIGLVGDTRLMYLDSTPDGDYERGQYGGVEALVLVIEFFPGDRLDDLVSDEGLRGRTIGLKGGDFTFAIADYEAWYFGSTARAGLELEGRI